MLFGYNNAIYTLSWLNKKSVLPTKQSQILVNNLNKVSLMSFSVVLLQKVTNNSCHHQRAHFIRLYLILARDSLID